MLDIIRSKNFDRSFEKIKQSGIKSTFLEKLKFVVDSLCNNKKLPKSYRDHELTGEFKGFRECHIKGDLLLIYQIKKNELILVLVDIGSHSELFN